MFRQVLKEMLTARNCIVEEETEENISAIKSDGERLFIFFNTGDKLNIDSVKSYVEILEEEKAKHAIIIYNNITPVAKKSIDNVFDMTIELFSLEEVQYNITTHKWVPPHSRVPENEANQIKEKFGKNIPSILKTEPVCRFFGFKKGELIKIIRASEDGPYITYRLVK